MSANYPRGVRKVEMGQEREQRPVGVRRRTLLLGAAAGAGALALGTDALATRAEAAPTFIRGADVSWLPQMEAQ
ncbi:hypothetical protein ACWD25_59690, partial [Streptomyces sp. NPDC002920]